MTDVLHDEQETEPTDDEIEGALSALGGEDDPATAPTDEGDSGYEAVLEDDAPPAPDGAQPRGPDGKFLAKDAPPDPATPDAPKTPEAPADAGASPSQAPPDPFAGWAPFTFKADGVESALAGVVANDTHVVIPRAVWDSEFRPKHLANREAWQGERQQWQQRITQAEQYARQTEAQRSEREQQAEAVLAEFSHLIGDPTRLQEFLADFERNAPIMQARIEAQTYKAQLEQRTRAEQAQQQQADWADMYNRSLETFEQGVLGMLEDPKYAGLTPTDEERGELLRELWGEVDDPQPGRTPYGARYVIIPHRDIPELGYRRGEPTLDRAAIAALLDRKAAFLMKRQAAWQQAAQTTTRNAAAVAPPATSPRTAKPSTPTKPTSAPPVRAAKPRTVPPVTAHRITDEDREAWANDYGADLD